MPHAIDGETTISVTCNDWSRQLAYDDYYTLTATLVKVNEP